MQYLYLTIDEAMLIHQEMYIFFYVANFSSPLRLDVFSFVYYKAGLNMFRSFDFSAEVYMTPFDFTAYSQFLKGKNTSKKELQGA